ncbi:hypothetical protein P153DRAFT_372286 [Dothidotthia symphoricarpi CBS 119687]|uniref:Uncharacterized protein n=1 Tax=Dothidotthia symphoricarpi CBS 119687 TaxID=1392245 RepID=A0A6A6AT12_9PLEO|nr:uncharacterized protein P153DRAFT_372286 [Dothidotthia symphoricarpi CBS 119687]KAF2133681.1 hypothetical protein P153DRAFT_372286 [Dothidotthia symphoricarpi CBS 119687]
MLSNTFARSMRCLIPTHSSPTLFLRGSRHISTLPENPSIYVHDHPLDRTKSLLSLLPTTPPTPQLAIGTCTSLPATPQSFTPNPPFLQILSSVCATYAAHDPMVQQQAAVFASPGGFNLGGSNDGANNQAGAGGGTRGGWIHVSDLRNPPDYGRIAWPEDIIGSLEVSGHGKVVDGGNWSESGTYRIVTREGILGLTDFMRGKVMERLRELEREIKDKS